METTDDLHWKSLLIEIKALKDRVRILEHTKAEMSDINDMRKVLIRRLKED